MTMFRRIAFFIGLNIVVVMTISVVSGLLGVGPYLSSRGINYGALMTMCLLWGMGGAFISLLISRLMAKWMMGVKLIDPNSHDPRSREVLDTVYRLARQGGIHTMPQVGIYDSPEVNAFATGPTKNRALVAVSSGLLETMDKRSIDGILGHEVAHILNGDMVTMTLIQGVVNAFVMALARVAAFAIDSFLRDRNERGGGLGHFGYFAVVWILELLLFIPGSMVVAWFSRQREYRADKGGAQLAGRENMVLALRNLARVHDLNASPASQSAPAYAAMKISGSKRSNMALLFSTHPPLEDRIARLERGL